MDQASIHAWLEQHKTHTDYAYYTSLDSSKKIIGVPIRLVETLATQMGKNHTLGLELYQSDVLELELLGAMILEADKISRIEAYKLIFEIDSFLAADALIFHTLKNRFLDYMILIDENNPKHRRAGWCYIITKVIDDTFKDYQPIMNYIEHHLDDEPYFVQDMMYRTLNEIAVHETRYMKDALKLKYKLEALMKKDTKLSSLITFEPISIKR